MAAKIKPIYRMALPFLAAIAGVQLLVALLTIVVLAMTDGDRTKEEKSRFDRQAAALINGYIEQQNLFVTQLAALPAESTPSSLPGVSVIRVVPANAEIPKDLGYTHQDMLRRAIQTRTNIHPEASHVSTGDVMISQVRVLNGGGFLLAGFSAVPLVESLKALADKEGAIRVRQKIGATGTVSEVVELNARAAFSLSGVKLINPNWTLEYKAPVGPSAILVVAIALIIAALIIPMLAFLLVRMYEARIRHDLDALHGVTRGEELSSPLHFESMQELWSILTGFASRHAPTPSAGGKAASAIRTHDVAGIVEDAEALSLMPVAVPIEESQVQVAKQAAPALVLEKAQEEEPEVIQDEHDVAELSPLEFTLSKKGGDDTSAKSGFPAHVFRDYDIRGKAVTEISEDLAVQIGRAVATEAQERGERTVVVGRDVRLSSDLLAKALIRGLTESGCDVVDVGMVPSPVLYFAAKNIGSGSGVMVTASHNPAPDNGFKIMLAGHTLGGIEIRALRERIQRKDFAKGSGSVVQHSVDDDYLQRIADDILLARTFNVVVDAGNGVAGPMAVRMLEEMGCTVSPLYCEPDGNFPHHDPDPSNHDNLEDLLSDVAISGADLGLAFDGDGDRVVIVTNSTKIVASDRLLMLFAREVLATQPGADILFDVKCSRDLVSVITTHGGRPVMTKTGHSWLKAGVAETGAPLAGEMSGHFIFNDRWGDFDDGLYAAARFLEILAQSTGVADDLFAEFPERISTPELQVPVSEEEKPLVMERLLASKDEIFEGTVNTTDGLRVEFAGGWGIVRASNTGSYLVARFEANTTDDLEMVKAFFRDRLHKADPMMLLPF